MAYFFAILLGMYSASVTLVYLKFRKNKLVSGIEGLIEGAKWISWLIFWFVPPVYLADQHSPKEGRLVLILLWLFPTAIVMFVKGRKAWKRGEWEHQFKKKEDQKRRRND